MFVVVGCGLWLLSWKARRPLSFPLFASPCSRSPPLRPCMSEAMRLGLRVVMAFVVLAVKGKSWEMGVDTGRGCGAL